MDSHVNEMDGDRMDILELSLVWRDSRILSTNVWFQSYPDYGESLVSGLSLTRILTLTFSLD